MHGGLALEGAVEDALALLVFAGGFVGVGQGHFQVVHQAVEAHGQQLGGADAFQGEAVAQPAAAEVPPRFAGGAQVAVNLGGGAFAFFGGADILPIGFGAGLGAVVPVAVQDGAVGQADDPAVSRAGVVQQAEAVHPEVVFLFEGGQVFLQDGVPVFGFSQQIDHGGEKGRLAAPQVIRAVAVGNVAQGIEQVGEVVQHVFDELELAGFLQPQHGEVAVPVIDLPEAPARHHIGVG